MSLALSIERELNDDGPRLKRDFRRGDYSPQVFRRKSIKFCDMIP